MSSPSVSPLCQDQRPELRALAERVAAMAIEAGADAAEVILGSGSELSVKVRKGQPELVHEAQSRGLGLRVFADHRAAVTFSSDFTEASLRKFTRDAVELSRLSEPSPYNELPERADLRLRRRRPRVFFASAAARGKAAARRRCLAQESGAGSSLTGRILACEKKTACQTS